MSETAHVPHWTDGASCRGRSRLFFSEDRFSVALAVRICEGCPVRADCENDARSNEDPYHRFGVLGGFTVSERRRWTDARSDR